MVAGRLRSREQSPAPCEPKMVIPCKIAQTPLWKPLRRQRPFSTPESVRDGPGRLGYLRGEFSAMREPPGRSGRYCEHAMNDSVHTSLRSRLAPCIHTCVNSVVQINRAARASCRTCNGDIVSARACPDPTLWSMYIVSQEKGSFHRPL